MKKIKINSMFKAGIPLAMAEALAVRVRSILRAGGMPVSFQAGKNPNVWTENKVDQVLATQAVDSGAPVTRNAHTYGNERAFDSHEDAMCGLLPRRRGTIVAGVLARLFEGGSPLTAWDGVEEFRTRHLDKAVRSLKLEYGWPIESIVFPTYKRDGTIHYVTGYKLPEGAIDYAYRTLDAKLWIQTVKLAQAAKRMRDSEKAAALDRYRFNTSHPTTRNMDEFTFSQYLTRRWF
jgi:hypothetical protein